MHRFAHRILTNFAALIAVASSMYAAGSSSIVISQVYGGGGNSGATFKNDFIELYNLSASPVNVSGWSVQYASATGTAWQVTNLSGTIQPGKYYLVQEAVGAGGTTNLPTADATGTIAMSATAGKVALVNTTTALTGACPTGATIIDFVGFGGTANCFEGASAAPAPSNTVADIRKGGGATDTDVNTSDFATGAPNPRNSACCALSITTASPLPNAVVNVAYSQTFAAGGASGTPTWALSAGSTLPFDFAISSAGVLTGTATSTVGSPFTLTVQVTDASNTTASKQFTLTVNGSVTCNATHTISQIQGSGDTSLLVSNTETTSGIVTAIKSNGFFIQMPAPGDSDPQTSDGVFVFTSSAPPVAASVGNSVCVTGKVAEFIPSTDLSSPPVTEISNVTSVTALASGQPLPAPVVLSALEMAPNSAINNLEKYEGMRVQVNSLVAISPTQGSITETSATSSSNGVFYGVIQGIARPFREPGVQLPDALPAGSPANVPRFDSNPERLRIDTKAQPGSTILEVTSGASITGIVGPLDFGFRTYTIDTDPSPVPIASANSPFTAAPVPLPTELTVASFNMQRFYDTTADPSVSDVVLTATALNNRLNKMSLAIRNVLNTPDIIGVEEMENLTTLQSLAIKVNNDAVAASAPNPNYTAYLVEGNDIGGIDVGFLVKSTKVSVIDVTQYGSTTTYTDPNTSQQAILNDRPPLVLRATAQSGANTAPLPVTVIVNHLRSLSAVDDPVDGNRVRTKRRAQAEFLANLIQARQVANPSENIVSLGDYNAFAFNDGYGDSMGTLKGLPTPADQVVLASPDLVNPNLTDLTDTLPADQRYSYTFDGNAQELDHVLANQAIFSRFTRFAIARNNADFPESFRNTSTRPERISDHDPAVAYFSLPTAVDASSQVTATKSGLIYNRGTRLFYGTFTITNNSAQTIAAPIQVVLTNLTPGVTLANATGSFAGSPYITAAGSLAPGASLSVPVQFSNPSNSPINTTVKIYTGAF
jgi:predicted extracellular nuclease